MTAAPMETVDRAVQTIQELKLFKGMELWSFELMLPLVERMRLDSSTLSAEDYTTLYITFADWALDKVKNVSDKETAVQFVKDVLEIALWAHERSNGATSAVYLGHGLDAGALAYYAKHSEAYVDLVWQKTVSP